MKRRLCWNEKRRLLELQPLRSSDLRIITSVKRTAIGSSIREIPIIKHCTMLTNFPEQMLLEFSTFFHKLALSIGETVRATGAQLIWSGATRKHFNQAEEVVDIRCRYGDITLRTWHMTEDWRFR